MTVSLYSLSEEYQRLIELAENAGTPDDEAMYQEAMRALQGTIVEKCDRCGAVMATLDAEMEALKHEEERLKARREAIDHNRERLKEYVQRCMEDAQISKAKGERFTLMIQDNPPKVVIDDEAKIDALYWRMKQEVAKDQLLAALKAGTSVEGAHLERKRSLRVR